MPEKIEIDFLTTLMYLLRKLEVYGKLRIFCMCRYWTSIVSIEKSINSHYQPCYFDPLSQVHSSSYPVH